MKYLFKCHVCYKMKLCDSKEELQENKNKHWHYKNGKKTHVPIKETMHLEMRTSRKSGRSYAVLVADD